MISVVVPMRNEERSVALLYDELKPLSPDVCLGIGGMVLQGDPQPAFFFSLERLP